MPEAKQTLSQDDLIDGRYTVLKLIGVGGMGEVYEVLQRSLNVHRALKILSPKYAEDGTMVERFRSEAQRMAQLGKHDHIVQVFDAEYDEKKDCNYILMEYIQGQTLREVLNQLDETVRLTEPNQTLASYAGLPLPRVLDIAHQVADALSYMHGQQLVHRDIKPPNIMIEDDTQRVVVMDLGIAKKVEEGDTSHTGTMVFTGAYASPEQFHGLKNLDHRSDIYSLGLVIAELYTGERVHPYPNREAIRALDIGGLPEFGDLLKRAITWQPDDRYPDMQALLQAIDQCQEVLPAFEQAMAARAELESAKLQAEEKEAEHWADDLWKRAGEREAAGEDLITARSYAEARTAYAEARQLFVEAGQAAWATAAPEQAERLRQEADKRGAQNWPRASKAYRDGIDYQTQAQDGLGYERAVASFKEALDLVPQEARLAALESQEDAQQLRERVIEAGARDLVSNELAATEEQLQRAEEAFDQEDYEAALSAYTAVISAFEQLLSLADKEKAHVARQEAQRAQEGAEFAGAKIFFAQAFTEAAQQLSAGLKHAAANDWTASLTCYTQATQEFGALQEQAVKEDKRRKAKRAIRAATSAATAARSAAVAARAQAEEARAERLVATEWQRAVTQAEEAEAAFQEAEESPRTAAYTEAEAQFQAAAEFFVAAAEAARLQAAHKTATTAQVTAEHAQAQARTTHAADLAPPLWTDAEASLRHAKAVFERAKKSRDTTAYTEAEAEYETATIQYEAARTAADREAAHREAERAKHAAESAKGEAEAVDIPSWPQAHTRLTAGDEAYGQAAGHWDRQEYHLAGPLYAAATQAYGEALTIATRGAQAAAAEVAQGETERAKDQAAAAQAADRAPAEWEQAEAVRGQAQAAWEAHDYTEAQAQFQAAGKRFAVAETQARVQAAQDTAAAAQEAAVQVRAQAVQAETLARENWKAAEAAFGAATTTFAQAQEAHDAAGYTTATAQFTEATTLYEAARTAADQEAARREAESAKHAVESAKGEAEATDIRSWPQAHARMTAGDEAYRRAGGHWDRQEYGQASPLYEAATQAYGEALTIATRGAQAAAAEAAQRTAETAQEHATDARAADLAPLAWTEAETALRHAETIFEQAKKSPDTAAYTEAEEQFQAATALYGKARLDAEWEAARLDAETAQRATSVAREAAQAGQAADLASSDWAKAETTWGEANATFVRAQEAHDAAGYTTATAQFTEAATLYEAAHTAAGQEAARRAAEQAKDSAHVTHQEAINLEVGKWFADELAQAEQRLATGDTYLDAGSFQQAQETYTAVIQELQELQETTLQGETTRQAAVRAQAVAEKARAQAQAADVEALVPTAWTAAEKSFSQAAATFQAAEMAPTLATFTTAEQQFTQAAELYAKAVTQTEHEVARQAAVQAQATAEEAKAQAQAADVEALVPTAWTAAEKSFSQAAATFQAAEMAPTSTAYTTAEQQFTQAAELYAKAATQAEREVARQAAVQVQAAAVARQQTAREAQAEGLAETAWHEATQALGKARAEFDTQAYSEAEQQFTQAAELYAKAAAQAEHEAARQAAVQAQATAEKARTQAQAFGIAQWPEAQARYADGEQAAQQAAPLLVEADYSRATSQYSAAIQSYKDALTIAKQARRVASFKRYAPRLATAASILIAATVLVRFLMESVTETGPIPDRPVVVEPPPPPVPNPLIDQTKTLAQHTQTARQEAKQVKASELATEVFVQAQDLLTRADQAAENKQYDTAIKQYEEATTLFARARQGAQAQTQIIATEADQKAATALTQAQAAADNTVAARSVAQQAKAETYAQAVFNDGKNAQQQADDAFAQQQYEQATEQYALATQLFQQAKTDAEQVLTLAAVTQENDMAIKLATLVSDIQRQAEQIDAPQYAKRSWGQGLDALQEANRLQTNKQYALATEGYRSAQDFFSKALDQARTQQLKLVDTVQNQAANARVKAEKAGAKKDAQDLFQKAHSALTLADKASQGQRYVEARQQYARATGFFNDAATLAKQRAGERNQMMVQAAQDTADARKQAEKASALQYASALFQDGLAAQTKANQLRDSRQYTTATARYRDAAGFFEQARLKAENEAGGSVTIKEARDWVRRYRQAYQNPCKNVATLVELGAVENGVKADFQRLACEQDYRGVVQDEVSVSQIEKRAQVSLVRRVEANGRTVMEISEKCLLEKQQGLILGSCSDRKKR